jgi:hypothetical protein
MSVAQARVLSPAHLTKGVPCFASPMSRFFATNSRPLRVAASPPVALHAPRSRERAPFTLDMTRRAS